MHTECVPADPARMRCFGQKEQKEEILIVLSSSCLTFKKVSLKIVARAMRMEAKQELNNLYQNSNSVYYFLRRMKKEGKDVEGGRCLRGGDGRLGFIEEDRAKIWKEHMEKIMNEENEWDCMVETGLVEGPVEKVVRDEIVEAMQSMKSGKVTGTSEVPVSVEMIVTSGYNRG